MTVPSNPIDILLTQNHWANLAFLKTAQNLTHEQFHRRFEIGPGSLHDTLSHVLGAMQRWTLALHGKDVAALGRFEATQRTADELLIQAQILHDALAAVAAAHPPEQTVTAIRNGQPVTLLRSVILTHVTTHGMHHRAQCANMFRQLSVKSPPPSIIEWAWSLSAPAQ